MLSQDIYRAAIGRNARLGDLYDVRTDNFLRDSLLTKRVDDVNVEIWKTTSTSIGLVKTDNIQEKFDTLKVERELQASVVSGIATLSGSGTYLIEDIPNTQTQQMSLIYQHGTMIESFNLRQNKSIIDQDVLNQVNQGLCPATHVVVEIERGGECYVTCKAECLGEGELAVREAVEGELKRLKKSIGGDTPSAQEVPDTNIVCTFRCKSDVAQADRSLPVTFEGALELVKKIPEMITTQDEKGVPLQYKLVPLNRAASACGITMSVQVTPIKEHQIEEMITKMNNFKTKSRELKKMEQMMKQFSNYATTEMLTFIDSCIEDISRDMAMFRSNLRDLILKIRNNEEETTVLDECLKQEHASVMQHSGHIKEFDEQLKMLDDIKDWKRQKIKYVGRKDRIKIDDAKKIFVFYKASKTQGKIEEFFISLRKANINDDNVEFRVIDENIRPAEWAHRKDECIEVYENGAKIDDNFYLSEGLDSEMCLVKHKQTTRTSDLPTERGRLKLPCPNSFSDGTKCPCSLLMWQCSECKDVIEYGIYSQKLYCKCGESNPSESLFRCNDKKHGFAYLHYPEDSLRDGLSYIRATQEKNILILGETGVGKSTWINSIFNYLSFSTLDEASTAKEMQYLIPTHFPYYTKDGTKHEIKLENQNVTEVCKPGESATQETRSHVFFVDETMIRLIDTPGIGDTRGIDQDKKNLDKLLSYLTYYDELHAICILLKPNISRLTVAFNFCMKGLLSQLHTSAKNNIVFCFTNARATNYQPGDTLTVSNTMLKDLNMTANRNNYFFFDNDSFRYLACCNQGIEFSPEEVAEYRKSWNIGMKEAGRLLVHTDTIKPHQIRSTISMNEARRVTLGMAKPMAQVSDAIAENMQLIEEIAKRLNDTQLDAEERRKNLYRRGFAIDYQRLPNPITVCAHNMCVKVVEVGENKRRMTTYPQVCHDPCDCFMWGLDPETKGSFWNGFCKCTRNMYFFSQPCTSCRHGYEDHMYMTYKTLTVEKDFIETEVQEAILNLTTEKEQQEAIKKAYDDKRAELQQEESAILVASAKFACFLKKVAIIPYNDALGDYLKMAIKQEEESHSRSDSKLRELNERKEQYNKETKAIDEAMENGNRAITPDEIIQTQKDLFALKHFGNTLKHFFREISFSHSAKNMVFVENIAPILGHTEGHAPSGVQGDVAGIVKSGENKCLIQ